MIVLSYLSKHSLCQKVESLLRMHIAKKRFSSNRRKNFSKQCNILG